MKKKLLNNITSNIKKNNKDITEEQLEVIEYGLESLYLTNEKIVIYRALYGDNTLYARSYDMFISKVDKEAYPDIKQKYRFEKLGTENEAEIDCSDIFASMARPEVIVRARYLMDEIDNDQSTLELLLRDGTKKYFYYNRSNPMPKRYIIEGKTWQELCGLIEGFWRGSISSGDTVLFSHGEMNY